MFKRMEEYEPGDGNAYLFQLENELVQVVMSIRTSTKCSKGRDLRMNVHYITNISTGVNF